MRQSHIDFKSHLGHLGDAFRGFNEIWYANPGGPAIVNEHSVNACQ